MAVVVRGIHLGSSVIADGDDIRELIEVVQVHGLNSATTNPWSSALTALDAAGIGSWCQCPFLPSLRVVAREGEALGPDNVQFRIRYLNTIPQIQRGGLQLAQWDTNIDRFGNLLTLLYGVGGVNKKAIPVKLSVDRSTLAFSVSRIEPSPATGARFGISGTDPQLVAYNIGNKVNSATFFGCAPRTVRCVGVSYDNTGMTGVAFNMVYEFLFDPITHDPVGVYEHPYFHTVPSDVTMTPENGIKKFQYHDTYDFSAMGLT
jgi:hypothetical protein